MRIYHQQSNQCKPCAPAWSSPVAQGRKIPRLPYLQQPVTGNQTVQEPESNGLDTVSSATAADYFSHDFFRIPTHATRSATIQSKLAVNTPGDVYEQEAESISQQILRMPEPPLQQACALRGRDGEGHKEQPGRGYRRLQTKHLGSSESGQATAPPIVHKVLTSPGQPLDTATRAFAEPRFGHDFSQVRVHTDATAARSAEALNALAYTVGRDLVFARGQYAPGTSSGRRLLAHELVHVMQQEGSTHIKSVQRAEVDDRSCASLKDIEPDVDAHVNKEINDERKTMAKPVFGPLLSLHVMQRLGGRSPVSPIENFIEGLPASKRNLPPNSLAGTKYSGVENVNRFYALQTRGIAHVVGSSAKIHGICVGADKLGHFFDQGFDYFEAASKPGSTASDIENLGHEMEKGEFGLGTTGVFSNADIAANRAGLKFYKDLEKNPERFRFRIGNYITKQWNEQANPSFYDPQVGSVVWSNLLTGVWQGTFTSATSATPVKTKFNLSATASGNVMGTFELQAQASADKPKEITIKNGKIIQRTTSISTTSPTGPTVVATPVSGISIEFEWERGAMSGKGKLDSINEQTLNGTLGIGSSITSSGAIKLKKA